MAIDTQQKRASAIHVGLPWRGMLPIPDGAIGQADRQQTAWMYSGILAAAPAAIIAGPYYQHSADLYVAGSDIGETYAAGANSGQVYTAGMNKGEVHPS